jgi:methyl-accepting chemotaxis protein
MEHLDPQTLQIVVAGVVAGTLLLQVILLIAILVGVRKAANAVREDINEIRDSITPLVSQTRELLVRVGPKIDATATDLAALTHALREQTASVQSTVIEISERARQQAGRIDVMVTSLLDHAERAATMVNDAVSKPLRQLTGVLACLGAVVETLRAPQVHAPKPPVEPTRGESGMFI